MRNLGREKIGRESTYQSRLEMITRRSSTLFEQAPNDPLVPSLDCQEESLWDVRLYPGINKLLMASSHEPPRHIFPKEIPGQFLRKVI